MAGAFINVRLDPVPLDHPVHPGRVIHRVVQSLRVIALTLILFSGGLDITWQQVRPVLWQGLMLSTLGVCLTAAFVAGFAVWWLDFSLLDGLLLGAIISSMDAAAVFTILRSRQAHLRGHFTALLELESGSNDPMGVFLTAALIRLLTEAEATLPEMIPLFFS